MSIGVGLLGLGTVGYGVYKIITTNQYFKDVKIMKILDKDDSKQALVNHIITCDYQEILCNDEIKVIIEVMGAGEFSYKCIKEAIMMGKHVITANKEVIAGHLKELTKLKNEYKVALLYEASVGGGIPLIKPLHLLALTNEVTQISGIINGTTNYILSKMSCEKLTFAEALKKAQELGFAEAEPTSDLEGLDLVRKIAILSSICYQGEIDINDIIHYGVSTVHDIDIRFAASSNYVIKYLACSKRSQKEVEIRIEPVLVKENSLFSNVFDEFNLIMIKTNINGDLAFYGKGAGRYPTANAVVNDLIGIMNGEDNYSFHDTNKLESKKLKDKSQYYLRVKDVNKVDPEIIDIIDDNKIITKEISTKVIDDSNMQENIYFYAKIGE